MRHKACCLLAEAAAVSLKMNQRQAVAELQRTGRTSTVRCQGPCALRLQPDSCVEAATSPSLKTRVLETVAAAAALETTMQHNPKQREAAAAAGFEPSSAGGRTATTTAQLLGQLISS